MMRIALAALVLGFSAAPALAQGGDPACAGAPAGAEETCAVVAQALESAQPQLGILLAGGNPTLGTASTGGIRLGFVPRVSGSAKLNLVFIRLPDILAEGAGGGAARLNRAVGLPAPALSGTVSVGLYPGVSLAPTVGGVGAVDLLATGTWLPLEALGVDGFEETPTLAYGVGARVGVLRESFTMPGVSVSLMYRRLGELEFGEVCPGGGPVIGIYPADVCTSEGDPGEFDLDLTNWSGRAAVSKRLLGFGATAGIGYDRFESDAQFAFRYRDQTGLARVYRSPELQIDNDRWSAFANASFTALFATVALEAGWLQGTDPLPGFPTASDFDPASGTFFGSLGLRVAL